MRKLRALFLLALLTGILLAIGACGSSRHESAADRPASSATSTASTTPPPTKTVSEAEVKASLKEAIAHCRKAVGNAKGLPAAARSELEFVCGKVSYPTSPSSGELRHIICNEVANDSSRLQAEQEQILQTCEREAI